MILLAASIFTLYISYIVIRYGMQPSISASFYRLKGMDKVIFTIATWGYSLPLIAACPEFLIFIAGGLIFLVGAAPDYRGTDKRVHSIFAEGGIAVALIWMIINVWFVALVAIAVIALLYFLKVKNHTWWIEVAAFISIILSLYLNK